MKSRLVSKNVTLPTGRTSFRMEPEFWAALDEIARVEGVTRNDLVGRAQAAYPDGTRTSAVGVFVLEWFREGLFAVWGLARNV
jgi:predicted DNA-binding ribbon-helix-helix protein